MAVMPVPPVHYRLNFKLGTAELLPASQILLPAIARTIKERHPAQLIVVGHTDTVESAEYNYQLGLQRAKAVSERLTSYGADPVSIEISSRGKTDLLVKTPDQTLEPLNRRAEVTIR
jgi:outer membrane protein OmpA-like peptidoglycan-associated protein